MFCKFRFQIVFLILMIFFGCATRPISNFDAKSVPIRRMEVDHYSHERKDTGKVIIKRDRGFAGSACSSRVFVDGEPVAYIRSSEKIVLFLKEGEHILSAWAMTICGGGMAEVKAVVKAGEQSSYRIGYGSNGDFFIYPTAF